MLKLDGYGWQWKIPIHLAFSKLVLNVKVKFLLISRHFLAVFWLHPPPPDPPIHWNLHICYIKSIQLLHIWAKFLSPFPTKYGTSLLKFWPEVVSHKTKTVSKQSFKTKCLSRNGMYPKLKVLVHFWVQFIPGKPKILPKTRIFPETTSLWLLNNTSTRSQINNWILIKLIKKIYLGGKNGLFKIKNRPVSKN